MTLPATAVESRPDNAATYEVITDYYGRQLQATSDLKTSACCDISAMPSWLKPLLGRIHPDVLSRYYRCGLVCPPLLDGCRVLDLGCGSGRDVYALAQLVGATGSVVGVDMTDEQLAVARQHQAYHADMFGYSNVAFLHGYIERLDELDLKPGSFDVIVSNCVVNLSPDKDAVLAGVQRLLKPGGEFYFSDVYADRRVPTIVKNDPVLYGECLGGALYWKDFERLAHRHGFADPRLVEDRPLDITEPELTKRIGNLRFYSATYRLFKLPELETACEDFGQAVVYKGTIAEHASCFALDAHHDTQTGKIFPVCGNSWHMLHGTRFAPHFDFIGSFDTHYGIFQLCGTSLPFGEATKAENGYCGPAGCC